MTEEVGWFVGIDWASRKHLACLLAADGRKVDEREFVHGGDGLSELCDWLLVRTGAVPERIAVAIETPHGPIVEALLERGFQVYSMNPKQVDRFRDRFTVAGAKDDSRDAHVLADALRTDRHALRRLAVEDPVVIELREWSRMRDELRDERTRLANRIRDQLWRYYPKALELGGSDLSADWFLDLWEQAPTPAKAAQITEKTVANILKAHRIRRIDAAEALRMLRHAPLSVAAGVAEAATAHVRAVAARLRLINQQSKEADRKLDELCARLETASENEPGQINEQRDVAILRSFPGIGRINLATLLVEAAEPLRQRDHDALRALSGQAPVTRRSGKQCIVLRRYACNRRLQNAVYHWSRVAAQHDQASKSRYAELRRRGHGHARALRGVGDRLLYVLCATLKRQTLYDPDYKTARTAAVA
jgi:transposase